MFRIRSLIFNKTFLIITVLAVMATVDFSSQQRLSQRIEQDHNNQIVSIPTDNFSVSAENSPSVLGETDTQSSPAVQTVPIDQSLTDRFIQIKGNLGTLGAIIQKNGLFALAPNSVDNTIIARRSIETSNLATNSINSRTIENHSIGSTDLKDDIEIKSLTVKDILKVSQIDLGDNSISDGVMSGNWNFGTGNLSTTGVISALGGNSTEWNAKQTAYANLTSFGSLADSAGYLLNNGAGTFSYSTAGLISGLTAGYVPYATNGTTLANSGIFIASSGNVGIGTGSPVHQIQMGYSSSGKYLAFSALNGTPGVGIGYDSTNDGLSMKINNGSADFNHSALFIVRPTTNGTSGYIGVGLDYVTPMTQLDILGVNAPISTTATLNGGLTVGMGVGGGVLNFGSSGGSYGWIQYRNRSSATYYPIAINPLGGNVGIAKTNPAYTLDVNGVVNASSTRTGTFTNENSQLIFDGDSLTVGSNGSHPWTNDVSPTITFDKHNVAGNGRTLLTMDTDAPSNTDIYYSNVSRFNIVVIWGGTNDVYYGATGQKTYDRLVSYVNTRRAKGFKVIVMTMISRGGGDASKNVINNLIRANWQTFADGIVDLGAIPALGADGAYSNTIYFSGDQIHLTDVGYALVTSAVNATVNNFTSANTSNFVNGIFSANVGIGTTTPSSKLEVSGGDIRVTSGSFIDDGTTLTVPDYVFEADYQRRTMAELQTYITENKHLPNIPDMNDISGWAKLSLQDRDMKLLEKVEENTLYNIDNYKKIETISNDQLVIIGGNKDLQKQIADLSDEQSVETRLIADLQGEADQNTRDITDLQKQMIDLQNQNQTVISFIDALGIDSDNNLINFGTWSLSALNISAESINLTGDLEAKNVTATETLKGNDLELGKDNSGKDVLAAGDTEVEIDTPAADKDAKIYVTPVGNTFGQVLYIDEISDGAYFKVKMNAAQSDDIKFNWLIVK